MTTGVRSVPTWVGFEMRHVGPPGTITRPVATGLASGEPAAVVLGDDVTSGVTVGKALGAVELQEAITAATAMTPKDARIVIRGRAIRAAATGVTAA
jgi:hypothetical protein